VRGVGAAARAGFVLACATLLGGCDERKPFGVTPPPGEATSTVPPNASALAAQLGIDAGPVDPIDPPAPAGELAKELEQFVNVESCVVQRAAIDPLLADALSAIGYETFVRDACRLLEAAKDRKAETCDRIDASSLRARCRTWVAMLAQTPEACPLLYEGLPSRGRSPSCLALAGKDPRLCAAEARPAPRATCEAMAARREAPCDALVPADRAACKREVTRWRSLLPAPLEGLPKLAEVRGKLVVRGDGTTPDPKTTELDLAPDLGRGAVVVVGLRDKLAVEVGLLGDSDTARIAGAPNKRTRIGVRLVLEPPALGSGNTPDVAGLARLERLELEIPGELPIVVPTGTCDCKVTRARLDRARGGEVAFALEGTVTGAGHSYRLDLAATTFVRDVVSESSARGAREAGGLRGLVPPPRRP
jgi:hypothetical protein